MGVAIEYGSALNCTGSDSNVRKIAPRTGKGLYVPPWIHARLCVRGTLYLPAAFGLIDVDMANNRFVCAVGRIMEIGSVSLLDYLVYVSCFRHLRGLRGCVCSRRHKLQQEKSWLNSNKMSPQQGGEAMGRAPDWPWSLRPCRWQKLAGANLI